MFDGPDICSLEGELAVSVYSSRTALVSSRVPLTENQMHESPFGEDLLRFQNKTSMDRNRKGIAFPVPLIDHIMIIMIRQFGVFFFIRQCLNVRLCRSLLYILHPCNPEHYWK